MIPNFSHSGFPPFMINPFPPNMRYNNINHNSINKQVHKNFIHNNLNNNVNSVKPVKKSYSPKEDNYSDEKVFDIFGIKLHFDDLLIIYLLFFLYQENVKDTYLYIALILLLLS